MVSFDAKAKINGKEYDALETEFTFDRKVDEKGEPSSHITNLRLRALLKSSEDNALLESAFSEFKPFKGSFIFLKGDEQAMMKELEFENACIIGYKEVFIRQGENPMAVEIIMTAKKVSCGSAVYEADWS